MKTKELDQLLENVSAISANFHGDTESYQAFYDAHSDHFSGFPGIWNHCIDLAKAFTKAESELKAIAGENYEWIDAIDEFSEKAVGSKEPLGIRKGLKVAKEIIKKHSY